MTTKKVAAPKATVLASWMGMLGRALAARGIPPEPIFEREGLDYALCNSADARFPIVAATATWNAAMAAAGDRTFTLSVPNYMQPMTVSSLGVGLLASRTGTEAFQRLERYAGMVVSTVKPVVVDLTSPDEITVDIHPDPAIEHSPYAVETLFAMVAAFAKLMNGGTPPNARKLVEFAHPGPEDTAAFEQYFICPVVFGTGRYRMVLDREKCDRVLPYANPQLASLNDRASLEYLARMDAGGVADRTRAFLLRKLPSGEPSREEVATALHVSERTLLRRLAEEQTSYRLVLDDLRRSLAEQHLRNTALTPQQIAFLLGFSDQHAFMRAFKRWSGMAPKEWRIKHASTGSTASKS